MADGATDESPSKQRQPYERDRYPNRWAPVLIAWADEQSFPSLAGYVVGVGAPAGVGTRSGDLEL